MKMKSLTNLALAGLVIAGLATTAAAMGLPVMATQ